MAPAPNVEACFGGVGGVGWGKKTLSPISQEASTPQILSHSYLFFWAFPKMGVPLMYPKVLLGTPIFGNPKP